MPALTVSGNEVTDQARTAALLWSILQQGGSTDGEATPGGFGVWRAATNLFRRGQCDAVGSGAGSSDWNTAISTRAVDATVASPFSPNSIKYTGDGTAANQGAFIGSAAGQAAAAGVVGVGSVYFKGVAGQSYFHTTRWLNTDATNTRAATVAFTATGSWQLLVPNPIAVGAGKTGDTLIVEARINGTRAESFWLAHAMLETGHGEVSPYIATSQGATAARNAARVQAPAAILAATQCWTAFQIAYGFPSTAVRANPCYLLDWRDDANNLLGLWLDTGNQWNAGRLAAGVGATALSAAQVFNTDDKALVIFACDAATVKVSVKGGAFVSAANAAVPVLAAALADIGSQAGGSQLDGRILSLATGTGPITAADAAALAALPAQPGVYSVAAIDPAAALTAFAAMHDTSYLTVPLPDLSVLVGDAGLYNATVGDAGLYAAAVSDAALYSVAVSDSTP